MAILNKARQSKKIEHRLPADQPKHVPPSVEQRDFTALDQKEAQSADAERAVTERSAVSATHPVQSEQAAPPTSVSVAPSLVSQKIERILEEDLADLYFSLDEGHRGIFKEEGERTARQIELVIQRGKSVMVRVIELIKHWLKFIPGVNKFFIEQEAKIKAEKILQDLQPPPFKP